jgi:hypothetical protein
LLEGLIPERLLLHYQLGFIGFIATQNQEHAVLKQAYP